MILNPQLKSDGPIDLHDLVTVFMYELAIHDPSFRTCELLDYSKHEGDGPVPEDKHLTALDSDLQEDFLNCATNRVAMFFECSESEESEQEEQENMDVETIYRSKISISAGFKKYVESTYSGFDIRDAYWRAKSQSIGAAQFLALQKVLDRVPESSGLRIRSSQGYEYFMKSPSFRFVETTLSPLERAFIYIATPADDSESELSLELLMVGDEALKWTVMEFSSDSGEKSVLDISSMRLGKHGLGGEYFVLEQLGDYYSKFFLKNRADRSRLFVSKSYLRIWQLSPESTSIALSLVDRVAHRLVGILEKKNTFCNYCGKPFVKKSCGKCGKVQYCDKYCQTKGWAYHKRWCKKMSEE